MRRYLYGLLLGTMGLWSCNEFQQAVKDAKKDVPAPPKDNYIVLLDLSDRILYNNQQQVPKDIEVVKSIYSTFKAGLNSKDPTHLYYTLRDKIKVLIADQKTTPRNLYEMVGNLRVDLSAEAPEKKINRIDETEKTFAATLPELYKQAVIGNNSTAYSGADIWRYFNEDLNDDLEKDAQNTLFILTDGYMDLEKSAERPSQGNRFATCSQIINALKKYPDWETKFTEGDYGLLPTGKKFNNLKVVLLQVNPKEEWSSEYSLLTKIWGKWFTEMGITNYRFIKDDNINEVRESLEKFMDLKIAGRITPEPWTKITTIDSSIIPSPETSRVPGHTDTVVAVKPRSIAAKPAVAAKKQTAADELAGPDESDASALTDKKKDNALKKKPQKPGDSILEDATIADGFHTTTKKKKQ